MADYVAGNGNINMMIRDLGYEVQFWVLTDRYTYNHQQQWSGTGHGVETFDMNNRGSWQYIASCYIGAGAGQNVSFTMYNSGLGFSTWTYTVWIARATVPPPPYFATAYATGPSTTYTQFVSQGDGGTPVREWQLAYGTNPNGADYYVGSNGIDGIGGLSGGTWWYFWARGRNDVGWGNWSGRAAAFTWRVPDSPSPVSFANVAQNSIRSIFSGAFAGGFEAGAAVQEWQLAYGTSTDINLATLITANSGVSDLSNLDPGQTYYFWARGRNVIGWGPWSPVRAGTLRAGALIKDNGVWKRALPYVNVNGTWKLSKGYVKDAGVWKESA